MNQPDSDSYKVRIKMLYLCIIIMTIALDYAMTPSLC